MRITIHNNKGRRRRLDPRDRTKLLPDPQGNASDFLALRGRDLPPFQFSKEKEYDGLVVLVEDEDAEEFVAELESAGLDCDSD